jgi:hypothetical protein
MFGGFRLVQGAQKVQEFSRSRIFGGGGGSLRSGVSVGSESTECSESSRGSEVQDFQGVQYIQIVQWTLDSGQSS